MEVIIISSDHCFNKPDPRMFTMALDQLKLSASQAVYVGDSCRATIYGAQQLVFTLFISTDNIILWIARLIANHKGLSIHLMSARLAVGLVDFRH